MALFMDDNKKFSTFYSKETEKHYDSPGFRRRLLFYLEDLMNNSFPTVIAEYSRRDIGIDIKKEIEVLSDKYPRTSFHKYNLYKAYENSEIENILDLITIVFNAFSESQNKGIKPVVNNISMDDYIDIVNEIFREELLFYCLNDAGGVRFYPDEEFQANIVSTIKYLSKPKYKSYLNKINDVLDKLSKYRNTELPIREIFVCLESISLDFVKDKSKPNRLNESLIKKICGIIMENVNSDSLYSENDKLLIEENFSGSFYEVVKMCHKYRHGKEKQDNHNVPEELFNMLFSQCINYIRLLIELDNKYSLLKV